MSCKQVVFMSFFSIVILVRDFPHLFPVTMESILNQTYKQFEVIVVKSHVKQAVEEGYRDQINQIKEVELKDLPSLMNEGLFLAKGQYIQFLLPGDYLLSLHVLEQIHKKIEQTKPDLIYCSYLERKEEMPPYIQDFIFDKKQLSKGRLPTRYQSCWFSVQMLQDFKGYSPRYHFRPNLDLFCRIFKTRSYKTEQIKQVLVDFVIRKKTASDFLHRAHETYRIILDHFGILASIRWFFAQDLSAFCKITYKNIKGAFWRS